jgi:hypothetical protein
LKASISGVATMPKRLPLRRATAVVLPAFLLAAHFSLAPLAHGQASAASARPKVDWPVAPAFVPGRHGNGAAVIVHWEELEREVRRHSPDLVQFWVPRQAHVALDGPWLTRALDWYQDVLFAFGVSYVPDVWDCENYAQLLVTLASMEMAKYWRADLRVPIGWFTVMPEVAWAGVPAGTKHALVMARTREGLEVIEPQTGQRTPLASYPNRHRILEVYFE